MDHNTVYDLNDIVSNEESSLKYQEQNDLLLESIIENNYLSDYKDEEIGPKRSLELFLTGSCKSNCSYCYLKAHPELYPSNISHIDSIIKNLEYLLDWYKENKFLCNLDIFSGEWLTTPFRDKVFSTIYEKFKDENKYKPQRILMADNGKFLLDKESEESFFKWHKKMRDIGISTSCSISIDGKYCDDFRHPMRDEDYSHIFDVCKEMNWRCHPMVSSTNISHWKENYIWWQENAPEEVAKTLMMLEVRDASWTDEKIKEFLDFLDFEIDYQFKEIFNEDKYLFLEALLRNGKNNDNYLIELVNDRSYDNISLVFDTSFLSSDESLNCSITGNFVIRLGDLSLAPCHRLYYPELEIGKYVIDDKTNKISRIKATNVQLMLIKTASKRSCMPHCEDCSILGFCPGFCLGAAYETSKNLLIPPKEVCRLYRTKIAFLIEKYTKMGILSDKNLEKYLSQTPREKKETYIIKQYIISSIKKFQKGLNREGILNV